LFIIVGWIHFAPTTELAILHVERIYAKKKSTTFNGIYCTHVTENILRYVFVILNVIHQNQHHSKMPSMKKLLKQ